MGLCVQILSRRLPELRVLVSITEEMSVNQSLVRLHPCGGRDIVALELSDERVQENADLLRLLQAEDLLSPEDKGVLVRSVQRVSGLESDRGVVFLLLQKLAGGNWTVDPILELALIIVRQKRDLSAAELCPLITGPEPGARVILTGGKVGLLNELILIPVVDRVDGDDTKRLLLENKQGLLACLECTCLFVCHWQGHGNSPRPLLTATSDGLVVQHLIVISLAHRPSER
mmetsp:Transcript_5673/g.16869  ORF Transcript_5673/g.16869 Transcript_5673/m.16869 type:complete len:230 (-) Transcript_5673:233-922(-)